MKKKLMIGLITGMAVIGSVASVSANVLEENLIAYIAQTYLAEYPNAVITGSLPSPLQRVAVTERVSVPTNINGNQGSQVFSTTINNNDRGGNFDIMFNSFTAMTDINVAIYVGPNRVLERMNVNPGSVIPFSIGSNISVGTTFRVVVSSNTATAGADANMRIRAI